VTIKTKTLSLSEREEVNQMLVDKFGVDESEFEELTGDVDTLAGLILELKGDFPRRQEIITYGRYQLQVLEMSKRRIVKVKYSVVPPKENEE
jgi:CBS domain containing-hemolysin-like protein